MLFYSRRKFENETVLFLFYVIPIKECMPRFIISIMHRNYSESHIQNSQTETASAADSCYHESISEKRKIVT